MGNGQIAFDLNKTQLVSKLIEGNYPNSKPVIPSEAKERLTLERETFLNSFRRVSFPPGDKLISINLSFSKNNIEIIPNTTSACRPKERLSDGSKDRRVSNDC